MITKPYIASFTVMVTLASVIISAPWAAEESQKSLKAEAKITMEVAAHVARARVPGGRIKSFELEREHGKLIWSFDISKPNSKDIAEVHQAAEKSEQGQQNSTSR